MHRLLRRLPVRQFTQTQSIVHQPSSAVPVWSSKQAPFPDDRPATCDHTTFISPSTATWFTRRTASSCGGPPKLTEEQIESQEELEKLLRAAEKEGNLEKIYKIIDDEFENATELNVTTAFCKLAKIGSGTDEKTKHEIMATRSFQTLVDMVLLGARRYSNANLLSIMDACGKLGYDDDFLLDKATTRLLTNINELDAAALHNLVTSLGDLSSPSIVLFDALYQRMEELGDDLTQKQKQDLADAFAKLGYKDLAAKAAP